MVITNLLSVIGGSPLVYFIWGNFTVATILNRLFFVYIIYYLFFSCQLHLLSLHQNANNPDGFESL
jgi:hypothetical protein